MTSNAMHKIFNWLSDMPKNQCTLGGWITKSAQDDGNQLAKEHGDIFSFPLNRGGRIVERTITLGGPFSVQQPR